MLQEPSTITRSHKTAFAVLNMQERIQAQTCGAQRCAPQYQKNSAAPLPTSAIRAVETIFMASPLSDTCDRVHITCSGGEGMWWANVYVPVSCTLSSISTG